MAHGKALMPHIRDGGSTPPADILRHTVSVCLFYYITAVYQSQSQKGQKNTPPLQEVHSVTQYD